MILFGLGPVWRAVIGLLRKKIKEAEAAHAAKRKALQEAHTRAVEQLERQKQQATDAHLSEVVNGIFKA